MVSILMILVVVVLGPVLLGLCVMLLVYFVHPDDRNEILGFSLAFGSILLLPYDVLNTQINGGLQLALFWQIVLIAVAAMVVIIIPFAFFFYESDSDPEEKKTLCQSQFCEALKATLALTLVFLFVLVLMYVYLNQAQVAGALLVGTPATVCASQVNSTTPLPNPSSNKCPSNGCSTGSYTWVIPVSFPIYTIAFLSFFGWFLFTIFAGVGLVALPLDLVNEFRTRPMPMSHQDWLTERTNLGLRAKELLTVGELLARDMDEPSPSRKMEKSIKSTMDKFEMAFYFLKTDFEVLRVAKVEKGGNPLWYLAKLVVGLVGGVVTLMWIVQICIFILPSPPIHPFLNQLFIQMSDVGGGAFPLFGVIAYGVMAMWLLWAVIKGNFRFGTRFMLIKMYPMELGNTLMNAFLFNTWLILLCSIPAIQFCVTAFPVYARNTSISTIFGTQSRFLPFFKYFWANNVFIWALLIIAFISLAVLLVWPHNKAKEVAEKLEHVEKEMELERR